MWDSTAVNQDSRSRLMVVSREAKKHKVRAHKINKHATTTVSHLHEGSIMQSFKIRMAKSFRHYHIQLAVHMCLQYKQYY